MRSCPHPDCGWRAVAPSAAAAREQYAEHVVAEHGTTVDLDVTIPEGMVQVRTGDGEWRTVTPDEARALHDEQHTEK